jgi:hypothetical protein
MYNICLQNISHLTIGTIWIIINNGYCYFHYIRETEVLQDSLFTQFHKMNNGFKTRIPYSSIFCYVLHSVHTMGSKAGLSYVLICW